MPPGGPQTLLDVLRKAEGFLCEKLELDRAAARLDAQVLLAAVLGCDRVRLYMDFDRPLSEGELDRYRELVRRRAGHEPVAYLVGEREFWSLPIRVDRRVLIPRPDTETLVEWAVDLFRDRALECFADVGTGSGCLACALAQQFPGARGTAVDRDADACSLAAENLARLGFDGRVDVRCGDLLQPVEGRADLLVANLPYIPSGELASLPADVRGHEPLGALDGGPDGLATLRRMVSSACAHLRPGGWLLLEVGAGQAEAVARLCRQAGLGAVETRRDLAGLARVVGACLP
ncbi:MAG: peptide chain release factor N(5)-glutamine methyltransferase [Deltaproteobacteria bacterium]|nr:peptide chain release factor N(5)-glutamine methyltransferase [Deltaproteobacteria bacterium]